MPVSNTYLTTQNGWVEVVTNPSFIRMTVFPETHPFFVYKSTAPPTSQTGGLLYTQAYIENATDNETFYVRIQSSGPDESVRVDTFWIDGAIVAIGRISLEDSSGFLALEDGSGLLILEN